MFDNPIVAILYFLAAAYVFKIWYADLRAVEKPKNAFPGTEYAPRIAVIAGVLGALAILAAYTATEIALGLEGEQKSLTVWALFSLTAAAFVEELVFRGYLVVQNRGRAILILSILGFSILFTLFHPFFWDWSSEGGLTFDFTKKAFTDTTFIFLNSLWFYALRFMPLNKKRSLIPSVAAHLAYNWGVFAVKLVQNISDSGISS